MGKTTGIVLGIVLVVIGLALVIFGLVSFFGASQNLNNPQGSFMGAGLGMVLMFIGIILIGVGVLIIYLTNIGKIFGYVARETAPAIEKTTHAVGKGLASGVKKGWKQK